MDSGAAGGGSDGVADWISNEVACGINGWAARLIWCECKMLRHVMKLYANLDKAILKPSSCTLATVSFCLTRVQICVRRAVLAGVRLTYGVSRRMENVETILLGSTRLSW